MQDWIACAVLFAAAARPAPPPIMAGWSATKTGGGAVDFCSSKKWICSHIAIAGYKMMTTTLPVVTAATLCSRAPQRTHWARLPHTWA